MKKIEINGMINTPRGDIQIHGVMVLEEYDSQPTKLLKEKVIKQEVNRLIGGFMKDVENYNFDKGEPDCQHEGNHLLTPDEPNKCLHCGEVIKSGK